MIGTLKIELPDKFEKFDCKNCMVWSYCNAKYGFYKDKVCTENCPLEIQGDDYCPMKMKCENCKGV